MKPGVFPTQPLRNYFRFHYYHINIQQQFTVNSHPALFEGEGRGRGRGRCKKNWGTLSRGFGLRSFRPEISAWRVFVGRSRCLNIFFSLSSYKIFQSSSLWRPTQLYLKGTGGGEDGNKIEENFPEASAWGVFVSRRFRPEEFSSAGDFGLRSFCQLAISTWVLCSALCSALCC